MTVVDFRMRRVSALAAPLRLMAPVLDEGRLVRGPAA